MRPVVFCLGCVVSGVAGALMGLHGWQTGLLSGLGFLQALIWMWMMKPKKGRRTQYEEPFI